MLLLTGLGSISSSGHIAGAEIGAPPAQGAVKAGFPPPGIADLWRAASQTTAGFSLLLDNF